MAAFDAGTERTAAACFGPQNRSILNGITVRSIGQWVIFIAGCWRARWMMGGFNVIADVR